MKIAVWHNLPSGGGKRALYDHVKGLLGRGHSIESWCPSTADQSYLPLSELVTEHILPFSWQPPRSASRFSRFVRSYRETISELRAMDDHCRQCAEEVNSGGFDLLFANSCMFFRTTSIGRYVTIPKIIYLQEPYRWLYEALPQLPWLSFPPKNGTGSVLHLKNYLHDLVRVQGLRVQAREEWQNAKEFDAIFVNSHFSRESVLRAYGLDAKVCYIGVNTNSFVDQHKVREHFVVSVGAIVPEKNLNFIVKAVGHLREPRPRLICIGNVVNDSYVAELKRLANDLKVRFEVRVRIEDDEIVDLLNRAKAMVYAPRLEPFGLAPLEAGACGLPVVAVAEGGVRETVVDGVNGLLVEHDSKMMAQAIDRLLNDQYLASQMGANGRKLSVENWSSESAIDRLEYRFREVLETEKIYAI